MRKTGHQPDISQGKTIDALQLAIDQTYHHLVEIAKADWKRLFAGQDPADECVTVRVSDDEIADELAGVPRAAFIPIPAKKRRARLRWRRV